MNNSTEYILSKLQHSNDIFELIFDDEIKPDKRIIDLNHKIFSATYKNLSNTEIPIIENRKEVLDNNTKIVTDCNMFEEPEKQILSKVIIIKVVLY